MATTLNSLIVSPTSDVMIELLPKLMDIPRPIENNANVVIQHLDGILILNIKTAHNNGYFLA